MIKKTKSSATDRKSLFRKVAALLTSMLLSALGFAAMVPMADNEMSGIDGQALFMSRQESRVSASNGVNYTFFRMGLDTQLDLNANIAELKLGETTTGVDLWAKNLAFGCVATNATASGVCVDSSNATATALKPFTLMRPYVQIATRGTNAATREVVGVRLGAESARGPLSIGNFLSFSGYLSADADLVMEAQGTDSTNDIAVTCGTNDLDGCPGSGGSPGYNDFGLQGPIRSLGLNNGSACVLSICASYEQLTVGFGQVTRMDRPVVLSGRRQTQAFIQNVQLSSAVDSIGDSLFVIRSSGLSAGLINALKGLIITEVKNNIKSQLAGALGTTVANLNNYQIPYNVENLHSANVDSDLFGLSFQREDGVQYPGYAVPMNKGWSMYLPNAFELSISQPTTVFVNNIMQGGARAGNIIQLPVGGGRNVYDNCWGAAVFC